jgi:metallophosphoesterase (TIGR00282 family)
MKKNSIKILFIGDIVGRSGRNVVKHFLSDLKAEEKVDFVIANGENLSAGKGITFGKYEEMINVGIDYFTSGNHIWNNRDIIPYMKDKSVKVLRPANYPNDPPGLGYATVDVDGTKLTIINLMGRVFIPGLFDDPFAKAKEIVDANSDSAIIIDFHAEATSEKMALAYYLDGQISAVIGTHTHVQTADEKILAGGTGFITDAGMCGPTDSVLGVEKDIIIRGFLTGLPQSHKVAVGDSIFNACLLEIDSLTKKTVSIKRISKILKTE